MVHILLDYKRCTVLHCGYAFSQRPRRKQLELARILCKANRQIVNILEPCYESILYSVTISSSGHSWCHKALSCILFLIVSDQNFGKQRKTLSSLNC